MIVEHQRHTLEQDKIIQLFHDYEKGQEFYNRPFLLIDNTAPESKTEEGAMSYKSYNNIKIKRRKDGRYYATNRLITDVNSFMEKHKRKFITR